MYIEPLSDTMALFFQQRGLLPTLMQLIKQNHKRKFYGTFCGISDTAPPKVHQLFNINCFILLCLLEIVLKYNSGIHSNLFQQPSITIQ